MTKIAIVGYGNLGRAIERLVTADDGLQLAGIFTRRNPADVVSSFGSPVYRQEDIFDMAGEVDIAAIAVGSANDVVGLGERLAGAMNTVDSFDTHAKMAQYVQAMDVAAKKSGHISLIGMGWDPGIFSTMRALMEGALPCGRTYTFWGRGVSQGHSEAIRRIEGVRDAKQYTVPNEKAMRLAESGEAGELTAEQMHRRECYVVLEEGADSDKIAAQIKNMPNYFAPYDTQVHFVSESELKANHSKMSHEGRALRCGNVNGSAVRLGFGLHLDSNPDFTAGAMIAYAKAAMRLYAAGGRGAYTPPDVPISALFESRNDILKFV